MPRDRLGDYRIVREIGRGGMGAVYEATTAQGERVAIKTILTAMDLDARARWELVERFMMEARAIRALDHRNIVAVTDVGQDEGEFFMVMEFLDGQSVRQLLDIVGAFPLPRATAIITDVCAALQYAHQAGVIHRDVKPDNVVILKNGVTKLTDFGLARIGEIGTHTQTGTVMGTFAYMSPEQARGERLDARSDLFSLGVTFYEMVAGERPFRGDGSAAVLQAILLEELPPLQNVPENVQAALARCLAKDPAARFQSAEEFRIALAGQHGPAEELGTSIGRPVISPPTPAPAAPVAAAAAAPPPYGGAATVPGSAAETPTATPAARPAPSRPQSEELPPDWFDAPGDGPVQTVRPGVARATPPPPQPAAATPQRVQCACGEQLGWNDATCWRCGKPNPVLRARAEREKEQAAIQEIQKLAASMDPRKKKPWWKLK